MQSTLRRRCALLALIASFFSLSLIASRADAPHRARSFPGTGQLSSPSSKPAAPPKRWLGLIGEYGPDDDILVILEKDGKLFALFKRTQLEPLEEISANRFKFSAGGPHANQSVVSTRDAHGRSTQVAIDSEVFKRRQIEPETGNQLHVRPLRPVPDLMKEARTAQPPQENGEFRATELVELKRLDPTIRLEIRYATTNNLLGASTRLSVALRLQGLAEMSYRQFHIRLD